MILESDRMDASELNIWRYTLKWARPTAIRKSYADKDLRDVLGSALRLIRFPLMHIEEFAAHVASTNILTAE
ncbi:BTB/POZ domain-containing protein 2-like protein, partial [Aphelenchoides avenae]